MKNVRELMKKIELLNKLNKELGINRKYYLILVQKYGRPFYFFNKKDFKDIKEVFIDEVANHLLNDALIKEDNYYYIFDNDKDITYSFKIGEI